VEGVHAGSVADLSDVRFSFVMASSLAILVMLIAAAEKLFNIKSSNGPNSVMLFQFYYNAEIVSSADIDDFM